MMALRPVLLSVRLEGSQSSTGAQLGQKYNTMEADLSVTAVLPLRSVPFWFVQRSPSQTKRLILRWSDYKVIPGCCVMKGICSVHYTRPAFGTGKPEEGTVPILREHAEEKGRPSLTKLEAMSPLPCARRSDGLGSRRHWQPATVFCSHVLVIMGLEL